MIEHKADVDIAVAISKAISEVVAVEKCTTAQISMVHSDGSFRTYRNEACHSLLHLYGDRDNIAAIVSRIVRDEAAAEHYGQQEEHLFPYYDWLFNRSPWKSAFLTSDTNRALQDKCMLADPSASANILLGGCIASRMTWEYPQKVEAMMHLLREGVKENTAFLVALCIHVSNGEVRKVCHGDAHLPLSVRGMNESGAKGFLKGVASKTNKPFNMGGGCRGVFEAFEGEGQGFWEVFSTIFQRLSEEGKGPAFNPFAACKPNKQEHRMPVDKLKRLCDEVEAHYA